MLSILFFLLFCFFFFTVFIVCPTTDDSRDATLHAIDAAAARAYHRMSKGVHFSFLCFLPKKLKFDYLVFHSFCLCCCVLLEHASLHFFFLLKSFTCCTVFALYQKLSLMKVLCLSLVNVNLQLDIFLPPSYVSLFSPPKLLFSLVCFLCSLVQHFSNFICLLVGGVCSLTSICSIVADSSSVDAAALANSVPDCCRSTDKSCSDCSTTTTTKRRPAPMSHC